MASPTPESKKPAKTTKRSPTTKKAQPKAENTAPKAEMVSEPVEREVAKHETPKRRRPPIGRLFWGLFFVVIGGLFLLQNMDIVDVNFADAWKLWPLLIVLMGLSILSIRSVFWRITAVLAAVLSVGAIAAAALGYFPDSNKNVETSTVSVSQENKGINNLELSIKTGAGDLRVTSHDGDEAVTATLESDVATLKESSSWSNDTQHVVLSTDSNNLWWLGSFKNDLNVSVSEHLPLTLDIDVGASSADLDLRNTYLSSLVIDTGASSLNARLGDRVDRVSVNIDAGASSVDVYAPKDSGVRINLDSGLSSTNFSGLVDKGNGIWESPDYDAADKQIEISAKIGAGSLDLIRY